jgi:SNF2 family DNA or RNA helicase
MSRALPKHLCDVEALELIYAPPEDILTEGHLRAYQTWMTKLIETQSRVFLGAEMGLGKTASTLLAARNLLRSGKVKHVLIVAPLRVAEETWPSEMAKWAFARDIPYRVLTGTEAQRRATLARYPNAQVTIINRENLLWLYKVVGTVKWPYDMLVYDEASRLKAGRTRTDLNNLTELGVIDRHRHKFRHMVELSGTPAPNGLIDLWGPIFALDGGQRLGKSVTAYKNRWFRDNPNGYGVTPFKHSEAEIMERIQDVFFSLQERDYLDLPPMIETDHLVNLTPAELREYKKFEREAAITVRNGAGDPEVIEAVNSGVLTNKLLQFSNGGLYLEDGTVAPVHEHKLDVLESIVKEAMGRPILVAYSFKFDMMRIKKRFKFARVFGESKNDMRDWNAGAIKMLVTHPQSAGHGLNFQHGSNIAVWYGLTWSLELYRQFIKRLHRSGQKADKVFLHRIIARGTADETILPVLRTRGATQDRINDAVRVRLEETL